VETKGGGSVSEGDSEVFDSSDNTALKNAEALLDRLEAARAKLEATQDPQEAVDVLAELSEIAKEVEAEVARAKREAEGADG
jgi:poly(A) polymerase Pap1